MPESKFKMDPNDLQNCKKLVWNFHQKLDTSSVSKIADIISEHTHTNHIWRGYYPFNEIQGAQEIAEIFWTHYEMQWIICKGALIFFRRPK